MERGSIERRNFILNAIEGALFIGSGAFLSFQTVLPALVSRLGGSNIAVGAVGVIAYFGLYFPQIFAARYVETLPWKKPWTVAFGLSHRVVVLLIGLVILLFGGRSPSTALLLFFILYCTNQALSGLTTPGWFDLFAKVTSTRKRGRLVGIRNSLGGVVGFGGGLTLTWLLASYGFPVNFALAFFAAFAMQTGSLVVQSYVVEETPSTTVPRRRLRELLHAVPADRGFHAFLLSSALLIIATMPVAFFTVYALHHFGADESVVGKFTLTMVTTQVVSALVNGYIADRYGYKTALMIAGVGMLCATVWALVAPTLGLFMLVFVFLGINLGTELMARYNMAIEYGPVERRSTYLGFMSTVLGPFYLSGLIGGWLSDAFGYWVVFAVGILFSVAGLAVLHYRVHEPRRGR
jgi:MFS family permease